MGTEIKYTNDGKKVVVLGNLNSQEKIVQEVFVVDGTEIPSGEHFVVKSLHDSPSISWKEKNLIDIEEKYNKTYTQKSKEYDKLCDEFYFKTRVVKEKLSFLSKLETNLSESKFEQFINFVSGDFKFIVVERYGYLEISDFDSTVATKNYGRFESLRLLSIFGKTNGELCYKMNDYYDGSGSWITVYPCKTMESAIKIVNERFSSLIEGGLTDSLLKMADKYNIEIPIDKMKEYKLKKKNYINENIRNVQQQMEKLKQDLSNYED